MRVDKISPLLRTCTCNTLYALRAATTDCVRNDESRSRQGESQCSVLGIERNASSSANWNGMEAQVRAAIFDDVVQRTAEVEKRTADFVRSMWQSLE